MGIESFYEKSASLDVSVEALDGDVDLDEVSVSV